MKFFNKLERKYSKYAIRNLMYYIIILYGMGLVLYLFDPMFYWQYLSLDAVAIMRGQIWRIVTFLVYPPAVGSMAFTSVLMGMIALMVYYNLGQTLERVWGSFRFNVFFFSGILGQVLASFLGYFIFGERLYITTGFLNFSIFLAFAICFPDIQFLLFYVLPIKAKWLAIAECAIYGYSFIMGSMSMRFEIIFSLLNVIVFLLMTRNYRKYNPKEIKRKQEFKKAVAPIKTAHGTRHKCAVCGRTEKDGDDLEFRYCSKCEGSYEYCQDHLYTHQHVTKDSKESE